MSGTLVSSKATLRVKGQEVEVGQLTIENYSLVIEGRVIRIAQIRDEWYQPLTDPTTLARQVLSLKVPADIFTFVQLPPHSSQSHDYHMEWDNLATIPITSFDDWWHKQIDSKARNHARKAKKCGVVLKSIEFDDDLLRGIECIYNETPVRQGKRFWHYKKDFTYLRKVHETYLDRSDFIGAFFQNELIGFVKLVYSGEIGNLMHIISMNAHRDKAVANALVAEAVQVACKRGMKYLAYDKFDYGLGGSASLKLFKQNNGFRELRYPRYYVPLTAKGKLAINLELHHGMAPLLPKPLVVTLLNLRNSLRLKWYAARYGIK